MIYLAVDYVGDVDSQDTHVLEYNHENCNLSSVTSFVWK